MKNKCKWAAAVVMAGVLSGCATRIGDFSLISTGTPQYASMEHCKIQRGVEGKDGRLWFTILPLGGKPDLKEAVDCCIDEGSGDFLERARFYSTGWTIGIFSYGGYKVIGDVGNSRAPLPEVAPEATTAVQ